jgi:hypothetical protein
MHFTLILILVLICLATHIVNFNCTYTYIYNYRYQLPYRAAREMSDREPLHVHWLCRHLHCRQRAAWPLCKAGPRYVIGHWWVQILLLFNFHSASGAHAEGYKSTNWNPRPSRDMYLPSLWRLHYVDCSDSLGINFSMGPFGDTGW